MSDLPVKRKITVKEAAQRMGVAEQFIRVGLQRGILKFGYAVQQKENGEYSYHISPKKFEEYMGKEENEGEEAS
ncbi:hypothetical protein [Eubacterium callanderi]|nr:hypothetical protein [Eubacterium callanderi]MBU5302834.1 hypothetical protein [Eubacterium callanderi]MBV1682768.1 hypothetical protein [Eubacterium callanderi]